MAKQKIIVDGTTIRINQADYVSLTDIANVALTENCHRLLEVGYGTLALSIF